MFIFLVSVYARSFGVPAVSVSQDARIIAIFRASESATPLGFLYKDPSNDILADLLVAENLKIFGYICLRTTDLAFSVSSFKFFMPT